MLTSYKNWNPETADKNRKDFAKDLEAHQIK